MRRRWWPGRGVGVVTRRHALAALTLLAVVLLAGATRAPARAAGPELLTNGGFETGALSPAGQTGFDDLTAGSDAITGWKVESGSVDYMGTYWSAAEGSRSVDLDGNGPGSISQTITTVVGQTYTINFQYSANTDGGPLNTPTADVLWNTDTVLPGISHTTPVSGMDMGWTAGQVTVTGTGSDKLTFASKDSPGSPYGIVIDAVSIRATTVQPTLTTAPTPASPVALGATLTDSATLSGTAADVPAGGMLTFKAFGDSSCATTPAYTQPVAISGDGTYSTGAFQPPGPGTYYWTVDYSGDSASGTLPASSLCGSESTVVLPATPGWTGSGPATTSVPSDGTNGTAQFSYNYNNPCNCGATGIWTFHTEANATGTVVLPWTYTGLHAWFEVIVGLDAFVTHNGVTTTTPGLVNAGPTDCCTTPSGGFSYSGTQTLSVIAGDTYGFVMRGSNFDLNRLPGGGRRPAAPPPHPARPPRGGGTPTPASGERARLGGAAGRARDNHVQRLRRPRLLDITDLLRHHRSGERTRHLLGSRIYARRARDLLLDCEL